jgi:hypothetical protein
MSTAIRTGVGVDADTYSIGVESEVAAPSSRLNNCGRREWASTDSVPSRDVRNLGEKESGSEPERQYWRLSHRADPRACKIADRHYNRQKVGSPQFVPPGRCCVLLTDAGDALWVTSWPFAEYVKHEWAGAWMNSCFRNEGQILSSLLITQAIAATKGFWGEPPQLGMVTFIDREKTRRKRDPGRCYRKAGFIVCGETKGGLLALQMRPEAMPVAIPALGSQGILQ